jgi:hypothetical protein
MLWNEEWELEVGVGDAFICSGESSRGGELPCIQSPR